MWLLRAGGAQHTPCLAVPSFFSPSRGSRSAESRCRNWRACFSLLCCRRDAASSGSARVSARMEVNIAAVATGIPFLSDRCWADRPQRWVTQTVTSWRWLVHASVNLVRNLSKLNPYKKLVAYIFGQIKFMSSWLNHVGFYSGDRSVITNLIFSRQHRRNKWLVFDVLVSITCHKNLVYY